MRGPCAPGYHVPTAWEWYSAFKSADPEIKPGTAGWQNTALPRALRLPTGSGMRAVIGGTWWYPGTRGHYWASTTLGTDGYGLPVTSTQVYLYGDQARRGHGFSVRCIADEERADPLCGAAQGVAVPSAPTSLLCAVGTAAGMAEATESYSWTCSNGPGEPVSCSAPRQYAVTFAANGG